VKNEKTHEDKRTKEGKDLTLIDGDQGQGQIEANQQGQEEEEDQEVDVQDVIHSPQRLTRSMFKALGNNGQLFSLFVISLVDGA